MKIKVAYKGMEAFFLGNFHLLNEKWMVEISLYNEGTNNYYDIQVPYKEISFINDRNNALKRKLLKKAIARHKKRTIILPLIKNIPLN